MKNTITISFLVLFLFLSSFVSAQELYTQTGKDSTWKYIELNKLIPIAVTSYTGITGSKIDVNQAHPEISLSPYANRAILNNLGIHTLGNAGVPRADFAKWSRWYQEDGNTQVMRLFKDEYNTRNTRTPYPRIEAEAPNHITGTTMNNGAQWAEFSGTYTIVKPIRATIFQIWGVNVNEPDGSGLMMLEMKDNGEIQYNPRDGSGFKTMITNATGKSFNIRVRQYIDKFNVYLNDVLFVTKPLSVTNGSHFRWGMYMGDNVPYDCMIFMTGAQVQYGNDGPPVDTDKDGIPDTLDNCPQVSNPDQADEDNDKIGDVCDTNLGDKDNDGVKDAVDNCPNTANPLQEDADLDNIGDVCDNDSDNDGIANNIDNCPLKSNPDQADEDNDNIGDVCDANLGDKDNDGVKDFIDNCPNIANPLQEDDNNDGIGNICERTHYKYTGKSWKIPGIIEVPFYDIGGEGNAYHDSKPGVDNAAFITPRTVTGPDDIEVDANNIGAIRNGEWVKYTVDSVKSGIYTIKISSASQSQNTNYKIFLNNNEIATVVATATGGWDIVKEFSTSDVKIESELTNAVIKVMFVNTAVTTKDLCNFRIFSFVKTSEIPAAGIHKTESQKRFSISPNPARNEFYVNTSGVVAKKLTIKNLIGAEVLNLSLNEQQNMFVVNNNLKSGIYFVLITDNNNKVYTEKLIIQ